MARPGSVEIDKQKYPPDFSRSTPAYSKTSLAQGLTFESYVSSGVVEVPEMETPAHVLILRAGSPSVVEWRSNGRDCRKELPAGSVSLIPAGFRHAARVSRPLPGVASILQVDPGFFNRSIGEIVKGGKLEFGREMDLSDSQIARLIEAIGTDVQAGSPSGKLFSESIATALSAYIAQQYAVSRPILESYRGGLSRSNLNRVREYIDTHLGEKLELGELASVSGLNLFHFARAFKQSTGESPHQYVLRQRVERAKNLLRDPQSTVLSASALTGFVDQSHFSKVFRRVVGVSPSEFRSTA